VSCSTSKFQFIGVGKTSLVTRYTENRFSVTTTATTGALFVTHKTDFEGAHVKLQIWDTAGEQSFSSKQHFSRRYPSFVLVSPELSKINGLPISCYPEGAHSPFVETTPFLSTSTNTLTICSRDALSLWCRIANVGYATNGRCSMSATRPHLIEPCAHLWLASDSLPRSYLPA
jgi:hypothetical protein